MAQPQPAHVPKGYRVRPDAWLSNFRITSPERKLQPGDCIKMYDGSYHFIQYVNSSGAYTVPLSAIAKEIKGHQVEFTSGGRTISAYSAVEVVNPLVMGGNSHEFRRYVKMAQSLREGAPMVDVEGKPGAMLGEFDHTQPHDPGSDLSDTDGHTVLTESELAAREGGQMAKKKAAKGKANGASKREKTPAKVRNCACGCGAETTGHFAPGHDARYHGWIKKLADGRIQRNGKDAKSGEQVISTPVLNKMGLTAKGDGFKATTPEWYKD